MALVVFYSFNKKGNIPMINDDRNIEIFLLHKFDSVKVVGFKSYMLVLIEF
jgi:hypothetical protein